MDSPPPIPDPRRSRRPLSTTHGGFLFACASSIWGTWVIVLTVVPLNGLFAAATTALSGCAGLVVWLALLGRAREPLATARDWPVTRWAVLVGLIEAAQNMLFLGGFYLVAAQGGSMLVPIIRALAGICTPFAALIVRREERFNPRFLMLGVVAAVGVYFIFARGDLALMKPGTDPKAILGLAMVVASMLVTSFQMLVQRIMAVEAQRAGRSEESVLVVQTFTTAIFMGPVLIALLVFLTPALPPSTLAAALGILAIVGLTHCTFAFILRLRAYGSISAQHGAIINYVEHLVSVSLSILFLHERATAGFFIGGALIVAAALTANLIVARSPTQV